MSQGHRGTVALRSYAFATSGGVFTGYLAAFTLVPHLSQRKRREHRRRGEALPRAALRLFAVAARHPVVTLGVWTALAGVAAAGLLRLRIEPNNYLGFFPPDHPTLAAHRSLDDVFGGSLPMYVVAQSDTGNAYRQPLVRRRIRTFTRQAQRHQHVGPAFTPFITERSSRLVIEEWFQGRDERLTRGVFSIPLLPTPETRSLIGYLDSLAAAYSDAQVRLRVTGPVPAGLPLLTALVESQLKSLALVLLMVAAAFVIATRSLPAGALLFLPNLVAPAAVGAAMGFLGIPLDFMTVVIFSMVLGVAVDDTLQLAWAGAPASGARGSFSSPAAVHRAAKAVSLTSLAAVVGFGALALSPFPVTQRLGGLMALGLGVAWLADLTLTPLLLSGRPVGRIRRESAAAAGAPQMR